MSFLKELLEAGMEFSNEDPTILIQGYGRLTLTQARRGLQERVSKLNEFAQKGDWSNVEGMLNTGVIQVFTKALKDFYENQH